MKISSELICVSSGYFASSSIICLFNPLVIQSFARNRTLTLRQFEFSGKFIFSSDQRFPSNSFFAKLFPAANRLLAQFHFFTKLMFVPNTDLRKKLTFVLNTHVRKKIVAANLLLRQINLYTIQTGRPNKLLSQKGSRHTRQFRDLRQIVFCEKLSIVIS